MVGFGWWALTTAGSATAYDPITLCYAQEGQHNTAFFIDNSFRSATSDAQERDLGRAIDRAYDELPPNGRLLIFSTARGEDGVIIKPAVIMCRPPASAQDQQTIGGISKTPQQLQKEARVAGVRFRAATKKYLSDSKEGDSIAHDSPILEQLQAISRYKFQGRLERLYAFTDGVQMSEFRQMCVTKGHLPPFKVLSQQSDYRYIAPESFAGVDVEILLAELWDIPSPSMPYCNQNELRSFWIDYFQDNDAANVRLTRLRHGAN